MPKIRLYTLAALLIALTVIVAYQHHKTHLLSPQEPVRLRPPVVSPLTPLPRPEPARMNEWMFAFDLRLTAPAAGSQSRTNAAVIRFGQQGPQNGYSLALWPDRSELCKSVGGRRQVLATTRMDLKPGAAGELDIHRKVSGLCVVWRGHVLFRSPDTQWCSKTISIQTVGSAFEVSLRRIQPLGEIYFTDDFMRTNSSGQWRPTSGNWQLCSLQIPERSANPFALFARFPASPKYNPLFTGRTRRYVGIGIRTERKAERDRIVYVFEDAPAWRAGLRQDDVLTAVDGIPVSTLSEDGLQQRVMGEPGTSVRLKFVRTVDGVEKEQECVVQRQPVDIDQIEETVPLSGGPLADSTFVFAGYRFWSDYTFAVSAKSLGEGEFGVVFYRRDDENYHLFKWSADTGLSLVKVENGKARTVAEKAGAFAPGQYYRLEASVLRDRIAARVDGVVVMEAQDADLSGGEVGLYAARSLGVYFDDVTLTSSDMPPRRNALPLEAAAVPNEDVAAPKEAKGLGPLFTSDMYMKAWASAEQDWVEGERDHGVMMRWNKFSCPGSVRMDVKRFFGDRLSLVLSATRRDSSDGYLFEINRFTSAATLYRNGIAVQRAERLPPFLRSVTLCAAGGHVVALLDEQKAVDFEDHDPLKGDCVGVGSDPVQMDFSNVSVACSNVLDETFTRAPVDWEIAGGVWGVMNRWVCDPRWSWFGGRSKALAAIWSKPAMMGDVSLDVFAGMEMPSYWKSPHEKACDLGLTLCGDGRTVSSGYTLLFGAEMDTRSRLYRGERLVAETTSPLLLFGNRNEGEDEGNELHRSWVHVSLQKRGDRVLFYLGDILGLEFQDPDPLPGGRVAVWTVDNGVLVARARVAYAERRPPALLLKGTSEFSDGHVTNVFAGSAGRTAGLKAGRLAGLSDKNTNARGDELMSIVAPDGAGALRVSNAQGGGNFALYLLQNKVNLAATPIVGFDYRMPGGVKLDLYFDYEGNRHRVLLTGPSGQGATPLRVDDAVAVTCGRFPDVKTDDQWHRAEIRLLDALRDLYPYKSSFAIENVALANYSNDGYLLAGFGGNHKGASYSLKNFGFTVPAKAMFLPDRQAGQPALRLAGLPAYPTKTPSRVEVASVEFPFQSAQNPSRVIWRLKVPAGEVVDFDSLEAQANERRFAAGDPALISHRLENIVELDLARAGFTLKDGDILRVALGTKDGKTAHKADWRFRLADDHSPPQDIRIAFGKKDLLCEDFERDLGNCYPIGTELRTMPGPTGGWLRREKHGLPAGSITREAMGDYCLRVQNKRMAHDYGVGFLTRPCDIGLYPILSFDYRLPPGISLDLSLAIKDDSPTATSDRKALRWATQTFRQDLRSYSSFPTIAVLRKPAQDNAWHHADINLLKKLENFDSSRKEYVIHDIHIADDVCGYLGNYAGVSFWLDNIRLRPVMGAADLRPTWSASDISGISDYRCAYNPDPNFTPKGKVSPADLAALRDGPTYFHLMLCDGAGNWSAPVHELVYLDVTPPEVGYFTPVWEIPGMFDIRFFELTGLDPRTIVVEVGSREYRVDGRQMWYDQDTQRLTWRAGKDLPALLKGVFGHRPAGPAGLNAGHAGLPMPKNIEAEPLFPDTGPNGPPIPRPVKVTLLAAKDFAGNAAKTPQTWDWFVTTTPASPPTDFPEWPPPVQIPLPK